MPDIDYAAAVPVLTSAANLIETNGLATGEFRDRSGCFCVHGALSFAGHGYTSWVPTDPDEWKWSGKGAAVAAALTLNEYLEADPTPYGWRHAREVRGTDNALARWNDEQHGNADPVVAALRNAAEWAKVRAERA